MKKYLFLVLLVLLLAVAGLGAAGHFGKGPLAPLLHKGPVEPDPPPPPPPHRIVYIGEIITPIVKNHAIESQIGMDVDVDILAEGFDKLNGLLPLIDHRIRMELYDFLPNHSDTQSAADRQAVHDRIQWIIESTVGPGIVRDVSVRTFYSR
jgi:hypothetical protein